MCICSPPHLRLASSPLPRGATDVKMALVQTEVDILKKAAQTSFAGPLAPPSRPSPQQVNHPYIVRCYDVIEKGDRIYFFMELCARVPAPLAPAALPLLFSRCSRASRTRATPLRGWAGTSRSEAALVGAQDGGRRALRQDCRDRCRPPLPPAPPLPLSLAQPTRRRRPAAAAVARERRGECVWAAARQGTSPSRTRSR